MAAQTNTRRKIFHGPKKQTGAPAKGKDMKKPACEAHLRARMREERAAPTFLCLTRPNTGQLTVLLSSVIGEEGGVSKSRGGELRGAGASVDQNAYTQKNEKRTPPSSVSRSLSGCSKPQSDTDCDCLHTAPFDRPFIVGHCCTWALESKQPDPGEKQTPDQAPSP